MICRSELQVPREHLTAFQDKVITWANEGGLKPLESDGVKIGSLEWVSDHMVLHKPACEKGG